MTMRLSAYALTVILGAAGFGCAGGGSPPAFDPSSPVADDGGDGGDDGAPDPGPTPGDNSPDNPPETDPGCVGPDCGEPISSDPCGDGTCDAAVGEDSFSCPTDCPVNVGSGSCSNICGAYQVQWTCQCESDCLTFGDCCPDYELFCPQGACGDGTCGYDENVATCPADCKGVYQDDYEPCLSQQCIAPWGKCQDNPGCNELWLCLTNCGPNLLCVEECMDASSDEGINDLDALLECGKGQGCFSDKAVNVVCGNKVCEAGEFASTCPADCKLPGAESCLNRCGKFTQNAPCQCDTECEKFDECCKDYSLVCE